jgi:hypothetical protein
LPIARNPMTDAVLTLAWVSIYVNMRNKQNQKFIDGPRSRVWGNNLLPAINSCLLICDYFAGKNVL